MKNEINIGLLGYGVVGSGVATILHNHQDDLRHKLGVSVSIKRVLVKNLDKKRNGVIPKEMFTTSLDEILDDPEIDLIIEVTGGSSDAIRRSLEAGKGVVTANKDVMAESGPELLRLADKNKCDL